MTSHGSNDPARGPISQSYGMMALRHDVNGKVGSQRATSIAKDVEAESSQKTGITCSMVAAIRQKRNSYP